jgi:glycosyltransferase involved in cell wall biosynthesis
LVLPKEMDSQNSAPRIAPLPDAKGTRPFWSVAVPTYNAREDQLGQALSSVLEQAPGPEWMEILVVDDCSPQGAPVELVKRIGAGRIRLHRNEKNLGLPGIWNDCIARSRGKWVHILHQDDYVLPGFYRRLDEAAKSHPEANLVATRSFYVDEEGIIFGVSNRMKQLEKGGHGIESFFYETPLMCAGVVVQRAFYEKHGGFLPELVFKVDCEMWARAVSLGGGVVVPEVLSGYRLSRASETGRLARTGEDLRDMGRFNKIFADRYAGFDLNKARLKVCELALEQAEQFAANGSSEAATASLNYWKANAPSPLRLRKLAGRIKRSIIK